MKSFVEQSERHYVSVPRHHLWSRIYIILRVPVCQYMSMWMHLWVFCVRKYVYVYIYVCMSLWVYVGCMYMYSSKCHECVSPCTTILLCLLSRFLSFARSLFFLTIFLAFLLISLSLSLSLSLTHSPTHSFYSFLSPSHSLPSCHNFSRFHISCVLATLLCRW